MLNDTFKAYEQMEEEELTAQYYNKQIYHIIVFIPR